MKLRNLTNILRLATVAAACAAVSACSQEQFEPYTHPEADDAGLTVIAVPELSTPSVKASATRVAIDSDDNTAGGALSLRWEEGDQFALWAVGGAQRDDHKNIKFSYRGRERFGDSELVLFASSSVPLMSEGDYTYRAFSPWSDDADPAANTVSYTLPAVQTGEYRAEYDIMSAAASRTSRLVRDTYNEELDLHFRHETHAMKITIPADKNGFSSIIERIQIEFPQPVAGRITFDAATGEALFDELSDSVINVKFPEPVATDEGVTFWVFTAPVQIDGEVKFTAFGGGDEKYQSDPSIAAAGQFSVLERGKITPVNLGIGEGFSITWFDCTVDSSQLGETVNTIYMTLADPSHSFANREKNITVQRDPEDGTFKVSFRTQRLQRWGTVEIVPTYESEHAIVSKNAATIPLPDDYTPDTHNAISAVAPYLFFEDFSTLDRNDSSNGNDTNDSSGDKAAVSFLDGWSAARVRFYQGTSIRIASYAITTSPFSTGTRWYGRADSAPLSQLKEGAEVNIKLLFDYGSDEEVAGTVQSWRGQDCYVGTVQTAGEISSESTDGTYPHMFQTTDRGNSSTNIPNKDYAVSFDGCNSETRLSWRIYPSTTASTASISHNTTYLYLDNIRVSIVNE